MNIGIVIPTFNEAKTIVNLIQSLSNLELGIDILVVDDDSPDQTANIVEANFKENKNVCVLLRKGQRGRGSACIDGFKYFLSSGKLYDCIFEMDADFSHRPQEIGLFLKKITKYDMVIGSRYVPGGKTVGFSIARRAVSKLSNLYAKFLLKIPASDYTTGYRCYRFELLRNLDFDLVKDSESIVLSEMLYQIFLKGYSIGEVPIIYVHRKSGTKFSIGEVWRSFKRVNFLKNDLVEKIKLKETYKERNTKDL